MTTKEDAMKLTTTLAALSAFILTAPLAAIA